MQIIHKEVKPKIKITNKYNLPQVIERAERNDTYDSSGSDISATSLYKPPRILRYMQEYKYEIEQDVSDMIFSLLGQSVHHVIERACADNDIAEKRLFYKGDETNGWTLSGQLDLLTSKGDLIDFKVTSAWTALDALQNTKSEFEQQLNILDFLCKKNEDVIYPVKTLSITAILRDWSKLRVMQSDNYPRQQVVMIPIRRWTTEEQSEYIKARIKIHQRAHQANIASQDEIPVCSASERWAKPDSYAVMKDGRKTALRVLNTEEKAKAYLRTQNLHDNKNVKIVLRKGEDVRCQHYCLVNRYCSYYNKEKRV